MPRFVDLLIPSVFLLSVVLMIDYSSESVTGLLPSSKAGEQFEPKIPGSRDTIREPSKSPSIQRALPEFENKLPSELAPLPVDLPYKVTVKFNSITVHNTHDAGIFFPQTDGEYDLVAYVQGVKVDLTSASGGPPSGLWDISRDESATFKRGTEVTVNIPKGIPVLIFTVGSEVDNCRTARTTFPDSLHEILAISNNPQIDRSPNIDSTQKLLNDKALCAGNNNSIGFIKKFYYPPNYQAGTQISVKSNKGDFTLRYTISVVAPPPKPEKQCGGNNFPIKSVTDNGNDGNVPSNAVDNNYDTRWSNQGVGTMLNVDLGTKRGICGVVISWYGSDVSSGSVFRAYISASKDGVGWTNEATAQFPALSPSSTGDINYGFPYVEARYIRVSFFDNAPEDVVGIKELNIYG